MRSVPVTSEQKRRAPYILLLSCSTGEGHNHAARAIAEELERRGIPYAAADPIAFRSKRASKLAASAYSRMIQKVPGTFNALYKMGNLYSSTGRRSPVYWANSLCARSLSAYIAQQGFSAVICTHLFAMEAMTAARQEGLCALPCFGVLTDYTCIPFTEETRLDGYFVPHADLTEELVGKGIPREHIFPTGIPVSGKFVRPADRGEARGRLALPAEKTVVLVMGGSAGCGHMGRLCRELSAYPGDWIVNVLVGRNREMEETLERQFGGSDRIRPVAFTEDVDLYMSAADVIITKPGGLTSTEAAVANVPLVHLLSYAACEVRNVEFFSARGMSVWAQDEAQAAAAAWELARDGERRARMIAAQRREINPQAAEDIVESVVSYSGE